MRRLAVAATAAVLLASTVVPGAAGGGEASPSEARPGTDAAVADRPDSRCKGWRMINSGRERIFGGEPADIANWPGLVAIRVAQEDGRAEYFCGGTLINERYVVTAAHCMQEFSKSKFAKVGKHYVRSIYSSGLLQTLFQGSARLQVVAKASNLSKIDESLMRNVTRVEIHPNYVKAASIREKKGLKGDTPEYHGFDIALFELESPLPAEFAGRVALSTEADPPETLRVQAMVAGLGRTEKDAPKDAIPLPEPNGMYSGFSIFTKTAPRFIAGSDRLLETDVPTLQTRTCRGNLKSATGEDLLAGPGQICAMDPTARHDTCHADSGGPLVMFDKHRCPYVVGLTSWGSPTCEEKGHPTVYTRISHHADWIAEVAGAARGVDLDDLAVTRSAVERDMREWQRILARIERRLAPFRSRIRVSACRTSDPADCASGGQQARLGAFSQTEIQIGGDFSSGTKVFVFLVMPHGFAQPITLPTLAAAARNRIQLEAQPHGLVNFDGGTLLAVSMPAAQARDLEEALSRPSRQPLDLVREIERALTPLDFLGRSASLPPSWGYGRLEIVIVDD
ncbi:MAG: serine protease [Hyphomicrobium sp.]